MINRSRSIPTLPSIALDALVAAISTMTDPSRGGTKPGSKHKKIIYLITDARNPLNTADSQLIKDKIVNEDFHIRLL